MPPGPNERSGGALAGHGAQGVLLLHGGSDTGNRLADTWQFTATQPTWGDLNCDCIVNAFDIEPFILALFDPKGYKTAYPNCDVTLADVNADGTINAFDIEPFIELLFNP